MTTLLRPISRTETVARNGGSIVEIGDLAVDDAVLADLLDAHPPEEWPALVTRALAVGARGLVTMGLGVNLDELEGRVRRTLEDVTERAIACSQEALDGGRRAFAEQFDPEQRSSLIARAISDFALARDQLLAGIDPALADSSTARFITALDDLLGPQGQLESRLGEALDPTADGSALHRLAESVDARFTELRDLIAREQGRAEEADRGTAKGVAFEEVVEGLLRDVAAGMGGCLVERTARTAGTLGADRVVGDMVVTLGSGCKVVVEVKNAAKLSLTGKGGVLAELDAAMANRDADFAMCVSGRDAFPREVGSFGVYGNRVLVVDDGDGVMARVGLRWAAAALAGAGEGSPGVNATALADRLDRIRALAQRFSAAKKGLTDVQRSIDGVRDTLDVLRTELLDGVDEARRELDAARRAES